MINNRFTSGLLLVFCLIMTTLPAMAEMTASEILKKVDDVWGMETLHTDIKVILTDKEGNVEEMEMHMYTADAKSKHFISFTAPANKKGISLLVQNADSPQEKIYLYLPKYKKVRTIAGYIKNQNFEGTDYSYKEIGANDFCSEYEPTLIKSTDPATYLLELIPKDPESNYSRLIITVDKKEFVIKQIDFFSALNNKLFKILKYSDLQKINGHAIHGVWEMVDVLKKHSSKLILRDIQVDQPLDSQIFTKRNLRKQ